MSSKFGMFVFTLKPSRRAKQKIVPRETVVEFHYQINHYHEGAKVTNTRVINEGGTIGFVNTGEISHVQNIETNIGKIKENDSKIADAFSAMKAAIRDSKDIPSEEDRKDLLEALDGLTENAALPEDKRGSLLKSSVRGFAQACQAASDIASVWHTVEGPIKSFFGFQ